MRLIDADAVQRWLADWQYGEAPTLIDNDKDREKAMLRYEILDIILSGLDDPYFTIDAEPVRHGMWIEDSLVSTNGGTYGVRRCSLCGACYQDVGYGWNYCPECGAKMEEQHETD